MAKFKRGVWCGYSQGRVGRFETEKEALAFEEGTRWDWYGESEKEEEVEEINLFSVPYVAPEQEDGSEKA